MHKLMTAITRIWAAEPGAKKPALLRMLVPPSKLYAAWMRMRAGLYRTGRLRSYKLPCRVISVGNLTAGGTGKTPMVLYLARHLITEGLKVVVLSRGYRGRLETRGGIVSDGQKILVGVEDSGDEPQIMARLLPGVPVIVGANRYRAGQRAVRTYKPDVILLDDAFQHLKLKRDLDLVLADCRRPLGNGYTLPAGELREPPQALNRTDAVIFTRCDPINGIFPTKNAVADIPECLETPVFKTRHVPVIRNIVPGRSKQHMPGSMVGRRVFAFSGVAKNEEFLYTLSDFEGDIVGSLGFPDHHHYSAADLAGICRRAEKLAVDVIVTTEKDYVKIRRTTGWPVDLVVMGIDISFGDDKERFHAFLGEKGILG